MITSHRSYPVDRERQFASVHRLGARPAFELLLAVARGADLDDALDSFAGLSPEAIAISGGGHFPPAPLTLLPMGEAA
jgi:hypothetical protein